MFKFRVTRTDPINLIHSDINNPLRFGNVEIFEPAKVWEWFEFHTLSMPTQSDYVFKYPSYYYFY